MPYIILYIVTMAVSTVFIRQLGVQLPSGLVLSLAAAYAIIIFHLLNFKNILTIYRKAFQAKGLVLLMQATVGIMWLGAFYVTTHYGAALHVFTYMCVTSLYGQVAASYKDRRISDIVKSILIFSIIAIFYITSYPNFTILNFLVMMIATIIPGTSLYIYMLSSNRLTHLAYSATEVITLRYWVLLFIGIAIMLENREYSHINAWVLLETFGLSFLLLIFPIFFLQKAIEKIGPYLCAVLMGTIPLVTFIIEKYTIGGGDVRVAYLSTALAVVILVPYFTGQYLRSRRKKVAIKADDQQPELDVASISG